MSSTSGLPPDPVSLLEASAIYWRRDFDAVLIGFILGVLVGGIVGALGTLAWQVAW